MNDLFILLGIAAALLIGGVAVFNKIQERKYRRRSDEAFLQRHDDVLLNEKSAGERDERIEPELGVEDARLDAPERENKAAKEPQRPWLTTLPEAPALEPEDERGQGMASNAHENEDPETVRAPSGRLYEPRGAPPPGSLREPPPLPKLYERGSRENGARAPSAGAHSSHMREPAPAPSPREPRKSIPPGSLHETRKSTPPGSLPETRTSVPANSLHEPRTSIPPGVSREPRASAPPGSLLESAREVHAKPGAKAAKEFDPPHPSLDFVARIHPERPLPPSAFSQLLSQTRDLSKPVRFAGLNAKSGSWEELQGNASYKELCAGLQLADRSGPASDADISRFCEILRRAAAGMKARALCPPLHQALASAIELDQFCADVDVTIGLNIVARHNQPFAVSRLAQLAEAIGFKLAPNGNFEFNDENGSVVFSLCDQEGVSFTGDRINGMSTRGITLLLDVPRVAEGMPAFDTMLALANDLCEPLEGVLVDDNGKPLNERGIENIRTQLRDIYGKMHARQISAGSARARRLFS